MSNTRLIVLSDVHLCHAAWYGEASEQRMERLVRELCGWYRRRPFDKILFLGDYSLDFWKWDIGGSFQKQGVSNTARFLRDYVPKLPAPCYLIPGNHEPYGETAWQAITGTPRQGAFVLGGYLFICCDNFAGELDPTEPSDGQYSETDLAFVKAQMAAYPDLPVLLCAHWFDQTLEPPEFFAFLRQETRIKGLMCGHDHRCFAEDLGEQAGHVTLFHDGSYSYSGKGLGEMMWGFNELELRPDGVAITHREPPASVLRDNGTPYHFPGLTTSYFLSRNQLS